MKNNASNLSVTQALTSALKAQAAQILPALMTVLIDLGYHKISHQRISQQHNNNTSIYQGLTRAQRQFGNVMMKWELNSDDGHDLFNLSHEVTVLHDLNKSSLTQNQNNATPISAIAPRILAYHSLSVNILNQNQRLTILIMLYYPHGSLAYKLNDKEYPSLADHQKQQLIIQASHLIANLHHSGWIHNDIKPSNILLDGSTPRLLLTDFALANRFDEGSDESVNKDSNQEHTINTAGTPAYLAPERWQGQSATPQSDIYAFGIMMYEILTGKRPFKIAAQSNEPLKDWAFQHCQQPIPTLPKEYQHYQFVITKVLAKRAEKRYQDMQEVLKDLKRLGNS